ncbi:30S ribosomal protein S6 [Paramyrothecium foliicola]|nr:30S ribosomal protein S6 [Paramyrothecium foliicola]
MEQLVTLFADIGSSKSREEIQSSAHQTGFHNKETREGREGRDTRDAKDARDRKAREASRSARDPNGSARRDPSRSTRNTTRDSREFRERDSREFRERDSREFRESRDTRESRDFKEPKDTREHKYAKDTKYPEDSETAPPPYQEIADAVAQPTPDVDIVELPHTHPSGINTTVRCVSEPISVPVDWVIHPSAPHFVICGRCYLDRIYATQQWRREFVKYRPTTSVPLRCHFGAIPHMEKRWSKVHTADEFLNFLKIMQRKRVAKQCPGLDNHRTNLTWYTSQSIPGLRICQECRRRLFGGTVFSKHLSPSDAPTAAVCHGSFNYTNRMVDQLLEDNDWDHFAEGMRIRIRMFNCPGQNLTNKDGHSEWWYKYKAGSPTKDLYVCEACFFDYAYKTEKDSHFSITDKIPPRPRCMASLMDNQVPDSAEAETNRAEIMRLLHGTDRRCYAQGTMGLKWHTTVNNPQGYGICDGCYVSKVKPLGGEAYFVPKRDIGKRTAFACWMNSYHPFFRRHEPLIHETLIMGDLSHLENSIRKFQRLPGCQQGGMGQGKNKRWWGWKCLPICAACMKGGNLADTPAAKRFELHGEKDPYYQVCGLYSMQVRDRFLNDDVGELLDFARRRQEMLS